MVQVSFMVFHGSRFVFMVVMVPGVFFLFFMVPGWFVMVPGRFYGFSWFKVGFSWFQVGFHAL